MAAATFLPLNIKEPKHMIIQPKNTRAIRRVDLFTAGMMVVMLLALLYLPWLAVNDVSYTALDIFRGIETRPRPDHALIFVMPLVMISVAIFSVYSLYSPDDSAALANFTMASGIVGIVYYINFVWFKDHSFDYIRDVTRIGFVLGLVASIWFVAQRFFKRSSTTTEPTTRLQRLLETENFWGILYLIPMIVLLIVFTVYPIARSVEMTMYNWRGIGEATQFVGLRHFRTVLQDEWFWNAFFNTLVYTGVLVPVQLILALVLALILNNPKMPGRTFYKTIYFLPVVTSVAIVAIVVRLMLNTGSGMLSDWLQISPPIYPLGNSDYSMWAVIGFGIWYSFGINLVLFLAALQTVPQELYDAAKVDGANWFYRMFYVTLPSIRPIAIIILFFAVLGSLKVFEQSFVLTQGGPFFSSEVVSGYIYRYAFQGGGAGGSSGNVANIGYASAAAFIMGTLIMVITLTQLGITRLLTKEN